MSGLIVISVTFGVMYFLFIRPQQRKMRAHRELVASLEADDEVLTTSGIYGTITAVDGEVIAVEVAEGIELRMSRASVAELVEYDHDDDDIDAAPEERS